MDGDGDESEKDRSGCVLCMCVCEHWNEMICIAFSGKKCKLRNELRSFLSICILLSSLLSCRCCYISGIIDEREPSEQEQEEPRR